MTAIDQLIFQALGQGLAMSAWIGISLALLLLIKSLLDFTHTGPQITQEALIHYRYYLLYSLGRLSFYVFLIITGMAFFGITLYILALPILEIRYETTGAFTAGLVAIIILCLRQFIHMLLYSPGVITSSSNYSMSRFYLLWQRINPERLRLLDVLLLGIASIWLAVGFFKLATAGAWSSFSLVIAIGGLYIVILFLAGHKLEPKPTKSDHEHELPNILMIGSDTLRADRLGGCKYPRDLTPNLDNFARRASRFTNCYVPCARTAPSLASMLTGTWPHTHGIRDTFVTPDETRLPITALPEILRRSGYRTEAVGDWAASDMTKFNFGFDHTEMPPDQWNIKYLLRQGPKDMRLFLSVFTQNWFGKTFLPEIYYLGGHPLTEEVGRDTRQAISRLAKQDKPFFLTSFMATTHPPFTSKYPYYTMYADQKYRGDSKFTMARLRDPFEIIRRQGEPKTEFDLDQIIDLYDGCVKNFDDEFKRIMDYLDASGLSDNTIVVVFSDHGMEFFEHETWGQGNSAIGDFSARVPLIIADPRNPEPHTVADVVRTVDITPTLLELLEAPIPNYVEGVSLVPLMEGKTLTKTLPAFYETGVWLTDLPGTPDGHLRYPSLPELLEVPDKKLGMISLKPQYQDIVIVAKDRMVRLGDWKLTYQPLVDGTLFQLFNIRKDSACQNNVIDQNPEIAEHLKALLSDWMGT